MPNELEPPKLLRLLATLEVSKALVLDLLRGRRVDREDVAEIRRALINLKQLIQALDKSRPWDPPEDPRET